MTIHQTRTAPSRRVPPAARQPGPVTLAIRALRPNEVPSWEAWQAQIAAEEREALRALRRRVAEAVTLGIAFLDETGGDIDLEMTGEDDEDTYDAEAVNEHGGDIQDEPHDEDTDREADPAEAGLGDYDGLVEQGHASRHEVFA